jgi:hypothetical protein
MCLTGTLPGTVAPKTPAGFISHFFQISAAAGGILFFSRASLRYRAWWRSP